MAYAVKYRAYYVTETGQTRQIDIEQDGYTGEILPISAMSEPELDWNGSDKKTAGIIGLEAKFIFLSTTDFNVNTLFDINPRKYKAKVKEDTTVLFVGWVQGDLAKDVYSYANDTRTFEVTATDGLGDLIDIDIKGDSGIYTSRESVNAFLRYALNKTGLELNIITAVDYYDSYMSTDANSINQVTVDPRLWIEEEKTISTKEVLESFCQLFYCRLFQRYGKWHFVCIDNQIDAIIPAYEYTSAGQQVFTTTTFSHRKELDSNPALTTTQAQLNAKIVSVDNKLSLSRQRPLKRLEVSYDFGPERNEINGNFFGGSTTGWTFNDGIVYETFSTGDGIGSYGLQITGATKMNQLGIDAVPYHFYVTNHLTTTTRYPYDDKWASVFMTVKKYEKIKLSFEYKAPELRSIKICVAFVDKGVFTEANVYDDLSVVGRDGLGSDGKWYAKENIRGGKVIRHLLIPNIGKNAAGQEIIKSGWESYEISSTDGVPNDGWVVLYFYRGGNMLSENNNATLQLRNIDMSREEYGDVLNNLTMVLDNPDLEYGNAKESLSIKYGEPPHSLNYSYLAKLNGQRTTDEWDRDGINPPSPLQALMGAMYMRQYSKYVTVLEGAIRAADVCMGDTLTLTGYAGKVFIVTRLRSKTKSSLHEVTLVELISDAFTPIYYTKSSSGLSRFYGSLRLFLLGGGGLIKIPSPPLKPARQGVEDLSGGTATQTGVSLDLIEAEFFNTPEDSTEWQRVGATDEVTGLYRLPTVAVNSHGVVIDKDDNTLETVWFKRRGEMLPLADVLTLYPTNSLSDLPLASQNGVSMWWTSNIETHPNAPTGLTGYAKVWIETLDKHCKVTVKSASGESYNFTQDVGATPVVWSGWKFKPHATTLSEVGKLFKADASQTLGQTNIWDNSDGTFSVGQAIKFTSAIFSVAGRLAAYDPLFADDLVTLRYLQAAVSALLSKSEFNLYYNQILELLAEKANKNHGHNISEVDQLSAELDAKIAKSILSQGDGYYVLGRDANGNAVMIDNKRCALNGQYLPDAIEGVYYSQTLAAELFVWPDGVYQKDIVLLSDKAWVRNGITFDYVSGLTLAGTPTDDENPRITVKMKWRFADGADWNEQEFAIFLSVEPSGTTITAPIAPSNLSATALGTSTIQLAWVDNSTSETGFRVYRGTSSGIYTLIASVGANTITYLDTGLAQNTRYYYMVQAYNTAGSNDSSEADALTQTATGQTPVDEVVAGSSRVRKFGTVVEPPTVPPSQQRPNIKFGFQPARYVEAGWVVWQHRTTGQRRTFPQMDQNNNPSAERPDSNWDVVEVTEAETWIKRTADAGCNLMDVWFKTPLLQTSEFNYHFKIVGRLMEVAGSYGVYLSIGIKNDIGNGGIPERAGFGHDQSASWRYLLEDCAKSQQFNDETGTGTKTVYPNELTPNLFRQRVHTNTIAFYTAYANYWSNHPYKQYAPTVHPIYSNTGESHLSINEERYMDASDYTMSVFNLYLNNVATSKQSLFSAFLADGLNGGNADARNFLRGYSGNEAKAIWQWFLQDWYFGGTGQEGTGSRPAYYRLYGKLGDIVRAVGLKWKIDHGSFLDFSVPRQNMYALDSRFLQNVDVVKHNPAGFRVGYPEVAALKATGKQTAIEWTPGALWDFDDSIPNAISTITTACADSWDAGVDEMVLSFVVTGDYYNSIAIPIINNLKAMGYWNLPKQTFTPSNLIDVDIYQQGLVSGWYHNDSDGTPEYNEPIHKMVTNVTGESGGKTRANIQKYGYRILPSNDPTI